MARSAIIERRYSRYIRLICGHFTDYDTHVLYKQWTRRGYSYCEPCEQFRKIKRPDVKPEVAQDELPF